MSDLLKFSVPLLGFAAFSGTGKTTLLEQLLPLLTLQRLNVALVKHSHHDIDLDEPGKDSYRLRKAGASQVLLAGTHRAILFNEYGERRDTKLLEQLQLLQTERLDLVLVEGYRDELFDKIELHRSALDKPFLFTKDKSIIALACDVQAEGCELPLLDINNVDAIAKFICAFVKGKTETR